MNKSLKFLAIGLALAVLLVSQVGVNRTDTAEAAPVDLDDEMVEFTDDAGEEKDFYKSGDTVHFFLKDDSLALPTSNSRTTVTWVTVAPGITATTPRTTFSLADGSVGTNAGIVGTTFSNIGTALATSTNYANYDPPLTPLVGTPTVTVKAGTGPETEQTVVSLDRNNGTFQLLDPVPHATDTVIKAVFEYEVADVFEAKHTGTAAKTCLLYTSPSPRD